MKSIVLIVIFTLISHHCDYSEKDRPNNKKSKSMEQIETYLASIIKTDNEAGFAIAIAKEDAVVFCKSYGVTNIRTKAKIGTHHIFHVASISKTFVATAVMQLAEKGKIDIDKPLVTYVPEFILDDSRYNEITVKQILNHTSGLPDTEDYEWEKAVSDDDAAVRYLKSIANEQLVSKPGKEFNYSNIGYDLLACLISNASGISFEKYIEDNILKPLQMRESSFYYPQIKAQLRVSPHTSKGDNLIVSNIYPYNRMHAPSSTLNTSALELSNWAIVNLNKGAFKDQRLFSAETYASMTNPTSSTDMDGVSIGLGWFIFDYKDTKQLVHSGSDLGFCSLLTLMPKQKIGIVVLSNNEDFEISEIRDRVRDILITAYL